MPIRETADQGSSSGISHPHAAVTEPTGNPKSNAPARSAGDHATASRPVTDMAASDLYGHTRVGDNQAAEIIPESTVFPAAASPSAPATAAGFDQRAEVSPLMPNSQGTGLYRLTLQSVVAAAAAPYGYTLSVWSSGAILVSAAGLPSTAEVLMLVAGATAAFLCLTALSFGGFTRGLASAPSLIGPVWAVAHLPAIGLTAIFVALLARITQSTVLWPAAGFGATATYLSVVAAQFALATLAMRRVPLARSDRST